MKTALDMVIVLLIGLTLASLASAQTRFTVYDALATYVNASNVLTEVSAANPLPVVGK